MTELLRWANAAYRAETPELDHAKRQRDLGVDGDPLMHYGARAYLALQEPRLCHVDRCQQPAHPHEARSHQCLPSCGAKCLGVGEAVEDNWRRIASHVDDDGWYRTPLRRAIETLPLPRRRLLRDLVPDVLMPLDVAVLHGIPVEFAGDVMYRSLTMLWGRYLDRPLPKASWIDRSESQQHAELAIA